MEQSVKTFRAHGVCSPSRAVWNVWCQYHKCWLAHVKEGVMERMFRLVNISNAARSIEPEGAAKGCHDHGEANQNHFEHGSVRAAVSEMIVSFGFLAVTEWAFVVGFTRHLEPCRESS